MTDLGLLDSAVHVAHLLGAITWIGGLIFISLIMAPVLRMELAQPERSRLIQAVGQRFRFVEAIAFAFLLASGIYKIVQLGADFDWLGSAPGRILLVKLTLVATVLILSVMHGYVWGPAVARARENGDIPVAAQLTRRVIFWARAELVLALVIVGSGALLRMNPF